MWLNGLCCGGLCGVGEVLKGGGQQHPFDDRQDQEELNPSSDCGTGNESKATLKARPHVVMGCTPSILSSNNQQQQQQHQRKDSSSLYGGNLSNAGSGTLADNNGAGSNKFANNAALNQAQMLGYGQGGKEGIAGAGTGAGEKVICFDFVFSKLCISRAVSWDITVVQISKFMVKFLGNDLHYQVSTVRIMDNHLFQPNFDQMFI